MDKHDSCHCHLSASNTHSSVFETLDELEFRRSLCSAAQQNDIEEFRRRLDALPPSKSINQCDTSGYTALHYAVRFQPATICRLLLERGANPNSQTRASLSTPLHRAVLFRNTEAIELLLKYHADVHLKDLDGKSAEDKAIENQIDFELIFHCPSTN